MELISPVKQWKNPNRRPQDEEYKDGWVFHIQCEGARWHVLSWGSDGVKCSEPKCIMNRKTP